MKTIFFIVLLLCLPFVNNASTSITTTVVSGHWALSGSPYLIFNDIRIDYPQSLTIDPGVKVIFQGDYSFYVYGILQAAGTAAAPITFTINDTTGWWDSTTTAGGWLGIYYLYFGSALPDSSAFQYCNISYTKLDTDAIMSTLEISRNLSVKNCTFINNKSSSEQLVYANAGNDGFIEISGCQVSNNIFSGGIFTLSGYGGRFYIHDNKLYQNSGAWVFFSNEPNTVIENNELYGNNSGNGSMYFSPPVANDTFITIKGNKIHDNVNINGGAIICTGGLAIIEENLICNNQHTSGSCGWWDGGGGIDINSDVSISTSVAGGGSFYIVRNNVIANNYSPFQGGGIKIIDAKAAICNNQIINNRSVLGGGIYINDTFPVTIKNNIFYGNVTVYDSTSLNTPSITGFLSSNIEYDHNWTEHSTIFDLNLGGVYTLSGDTITNIQGTDPGMVAPTLTSYVTESALDSDFSLSHISACINTGDTTGAYPDSVDYTDSARTIDGRIDIGAYQINGPALEITSLPTVENSLVLYPNPATTELIISAPDKIGEVQISNLMGQLLFSSYYSSNQVQVDVSSLPAGLYLIKVNELYIRKFVKQ